MKQQKFRGEPPQKYELITRDEAEGELLYESDEGSTLERTDDSVIFKVYAPKTLNWLQLADFLFCETKHMSNWAMGLERNEHIRDFSQLKAYSRDEKYEKARMEYHMDNDPFLYVFFYASHWWEMWESDEQYMFVYPLKKCEIYPLVCHGDMDAIGFLPGDDLGYLTSFIRSWYYRTTGYQEDSDEI